MLEIVLDLEGLVPDQLQFGIQGTEGGDMTQGPALGIGFKEEDLVGFFGRLFFEGKADGDPSFFFTGPVTHTSFIGMFKLTLDSARPMLLQFFF